MTNERFTLALNNGRYAKVTTWKTEPRLDLREWTVGDDKMLPTKKVISLKLHHIKTVSSFSESIQETLEEKGGNKWHLGYNVHAIVKEGNPCLDIRQFWVPPGEDESVPTKRGLCLRPAEHFSLTKHWSEIEDRLPELKNFVLCYDGNDHLNQLGMLRSPACNPEGHEMKK